MDDLEDRIDSFSEAQENLEGNIASLWAMPKR